MELTGADRFRLAVAVCVLKFKPNNQSFASYVLDLRSKFPAGSDPESTQESQWRDLALSLERDYAVLKAKYESEQIKNLALENSAKSLPAHPPSSNSQVAPSKKKSKKKSSSSDCHTNLSSSVTLLNLKSVLDGLGIQPGLEELMTTCPRRPLFSVLNDCWTLCSLPEPEPELVASVTTRVVEAVASLLHGILPTPTLNEKADLKLLETLGLVLQAALSTSLPFLTSPSRIKPQSRLESAVKLFERTCTLILNHLITAFAPVTLSFLNALFLPGPGPGPGPKTTCAKPAKGSKRLPADASKKKSKPKSPSIDFRAEMFTIFRRVFHVLDNHLQLMKLVPDLALTFRASLIMEALRALEALLIKPVIDRRSEPESCSDDDGRCFLYRKRSPSERIEKLATKDTLWYLCAILHILLGDFPSQSSPRSSQTSAVSRREKGEESWTGNDELLMDAISDSMMKLILRCKSTASVNFSVQPPVPTTETNSTGERSWKARSREGEDESAAVCRDEVIETNSDKEDAGGRHRTNGDQISGVSGTCPTSVGQEIWREDEKIELDEVAYGMLLAVMERYWHWRMRQ